ncbi:hypothetical protein BOTBODRAFT_190494 [Botryobasidium botryosum FD-172 SS1]|uniref:Cytochrome P450 n=1 Tax=Botryobasidium botryosum (strain FD-172 SS1) TaxID=930990 RepID=A0A067MF77_BOTB1|nr:hypothetical protein BOTBODRAFT_190494 [Botryobasidium botryosum FD-172 SS1]
MLFLAIILFPITHFTIFVPATIVVGALYILYQKFTGISLSQVRGPENPSFWVGHLAEFFQGQSGHVDLKWAKEFGGVVRIKGPFGQDRLMISDAKALQYVYQIGGYDFPKSPERRALSRSLADLGPGWAEGDIHKRQRRVLAPAFGAPEVKALLPPVRRCVHKLVAKWKQLVTEAPNGEAVLNAPKWLGLTTLETMGEAAFDYRFGALDGEDNPLIDVYNNFPALLFGSPSKWDVFVQAFTGWLPMPVIDFYYDYFPSSRLNVARENGKVATQVSRDLIEAKAIGKHEGMGGRDVLSLVVKANMSKNGKARLSEGEVLAQMRTLMLAGSETTSKTMTWFFFELAKHPDVQTRLREEIRAQEKIIALRGDTDFGVEDYDDMPYLKVVVKEGLRMYPPIPNAFRMTGKDDVIPLSKPLKTATGEYISELPVPKGVRIITSIPAYNQDPDIWGPDAHVFNPERWFDETEKRASVGVYSNLYVTSTRKETLDPIDTLLTDSLSFSGGVRFCPGYKFALVQLNTFLVELVRNFEFSPTEDLKRIRMESCLVVVPTLEGEVEKGAQMPLKVTLAPQDGDFP